MKSFLSSFFGGLGTKIIGLFVHVIDKITSQIISCSLVKDQFIRNGTVGHLKITLYFNNS